MSWYGSHLPIRARLIYACEVRAWNDDSTLYRGMAVGRPAEESG